ncbi:MAG TPA: hypothetical protein ENN67_02365 [Firmicutes bacterium]|nr:hypothetical protein [Bacillota bacterium]
MAEKEITEKDRELAKQCLECKVCNTARKNQRGFAFWFVKWLEGGICPACKAHEKVYGRKAHEPIIE